MELLNVRLSTNEYDTVGALYRIVKNKNSKGYKRHFLCWTLEDTAHVEKIKGETRIPSGRYEMKFRTVGGHHLVYAKKYSNIHYGMLELQNVPNFKYILIHTGNSHNDTMGCLLVGSAISLSVNGSRNVLNSVTTYKKVYPIIAAELLKGKKVYITMANFG